jgi:hypothetical protein
MESSKHLNALKIGSLSNKLDKYFVKKDKFEDEEILRIKTKVSAAEGTLCYHTVRHHQSFRSMDCSTKLYSDSKISTKIQCARTKAEAIVKNEFLPHFRNILIEKLKTVSFYSVSTDSSNHKTLKVFPLITQYFDPEEMGIVIKVLQIRDLPNETAATIGNFIADALTSYNIPVANCVALSTDNTNTNFGGLNRKGKCNVFTELKNKMNTAMIGVGCPAHILRNCLSYGASQLQFDIEFLVTRIYYYFWIYTVRNGTLKEFCDFVNTDYKPMLKHSKSRWLSLFPAIDCILKMYSALHSYFASQKENSVPKTIRDFFENNLSESYLWFLHSVSSIFQTNIANMEREKNSVVEIYDILNKVLSALTDRREENFIPLIIRNKLKDLKEEGYEAEVQNLKKEISDVYSRCIQYLTDWMKPFIEFEPFKWMKLRDLLKKDYKYEDIEDINYLRKKNVDIDDSRLFDQFIVGH